MDKQDLILQELKRHGEMLHQLITVTAATNARTMDIADELSDFRDETGLNFKKMERRVKLIESAIDETMLSIEKQ